MGQFEFVALRAEGEARRNNLHLGRSPLIPPRTRMFVFWIWHGGLASALVSVDDRFMIVPGARIAGTAPAETRVTIVSAIAAPIESSRPDSLRSVRGTRTRPYYDPAHRPGKVQGTPRGRAGALVPPGSLARAT